MSRDYLQMLLALLGFAAVFGSKWFADEWTQTLPLQIAVKELFPIVLALEICGSEMANRKILFMSDNMAVVEVINKQSSKEKCLMHLLRRLVLVCLSKNIFFKAKHIPGKYNVVADSLSRLQFQRAREAAPYLDQQPTAIPEHLLQICPQPPKQS